MGVGRVQLNTSYPSSDKPVCRAGQLAARHEWAPELDIIDHMNGRIFLTNTGPGACILRGEMRIGLVDESGTPMKTRFNWEGSSLVRAPDDPFQSWTAAALLPPQETDAAFIQADWGNWCGAPPGIVRFTISAPGGQVVSKRPDGSGETTPPCQPPILEGPQSNLHASEAFSRFSMPDPDDRGPDSLALPFVGHWSVHGAQMEIVNPTQGTIRYRDYCGPRPGEECLATESIRFVVSLDGKRLYGRAENISWTVDGAKVAPPDGDTYSGVGDRFWLEFVAPHLLKRGQIFVTDPGTYGGGNPFWCGEGLSDEYGYYCGA